MFTFFHCYRPETWDAQVKAGLVTEKTGGIRFVMTIQLPEELRFNNLAAKDGRLYKEILSHGYPFYIDRLQGGDYLFSYPYDKELVDEYKRLLGDKFYGFQMHEWLSNYKHDVDGLSSIPDNKWTAENIVKDVFRRSPYPFLNLSAMTAEELVDHRPKNLDEFIKEGDWLINDRQIKTGGELTSCDSYYLTYATEIKHGVKRIMPEIGAQTPNTRIQLAFARGMAKAYGLKYGAYYESWGGKPFSCCCYQRDQKNEWEINDPATFPFSTAGDNGGSSRSMQKRMLHYAYAAGASFMSEEWGMCNTFYDWKTFELSPYGKVKLDFIRFVEKYDDIGAPITPIAAVVPKDFIVEPLIKCGRYIDFIVFGERAKIVGAVHKGLRKVFTSASLMLGRERSLLNCKTYDCIDIITEEEAGKTPYEKYIDLTSNPAFAEKYADKIIPADIKTINKIIEKHLPCTVKGGVMKQFTQTSDGTCYVLITNNCGITNTVAKGETAAPFSTRKAVLTMNPGKRLVIEKTDGKAVQAGNRTTVTLRAGQLFFAKIIG